MKLDLFKEIEPGVMEEIAIFVLRRNILKIQCYLKKGKKLSLFIFWSKGLLIW
jgi:hypothetical protein